MECSRILSRYARSVTRFRRPAPTSRCRSRLCPRCTRSFQLDRPAAVWVHSSDRRWTGCRSCQTQPAAFAGSEKLQRVWRHWIGSAFQADPTQRPQHSRQPQHHTQVLQQRWSCALFAPVAVKAAVTGLVGSHAMSQGVLANAYGCHHCAGE